MAIKISGILKDGMGRPIPKCTIELKSKKTSLTVIVETEARLGLEVTGSYNLQVEPGKYDVSLYIVGFPPKRVGEINVYSDSRPGTLNDFLMMPGETDLTPELVAIFLKLRNEAEQAANEAKLAAGSCEDALNQVIAIQSDVSEKQQQVNADMIDVSKFKDSAADSARSASEDAGRTAADVATVAALKVSTEVAAQQAALSSSEASGHADRADTAANSVHSLTASAITLEPGSAATAHWNRETNNLSIGVPTGQKGDKGEQGIQGVKGDRGEKGEQGIQGLKGDIGSQGAVGPAGPQGNPGERGDIGPMGLKGERGEQGGKGEKGDTGLQGAVGPQGEPGKGSVGSVKVAGEIYKPDENGIVDLGNDIGNTGSALNALNEKVEEHYQANINQQGILDSRITSVENSEQNLTNALNETKSRIVTLKLNDEDLRKDITTLSNRGFNKLTDGVMSAHETNNLIYNNPTGISIASFEMPDKLFLSKLNNEGDIADYIYYLNFTCIFKSGVKRHTQQFIIAIDSELAASATTANILRAHHPTADMSMSAGLGNTNKLTVVFNAESATWSCSLRCGMGDNLLRVYSNRVVVESL
ncbi:prophage tail fiber N-terminal domain-containing protein [Pragia fontium]|uniref:prophage tail fiber N-terminal domain-containing protein n=1 Tax=Pragia fontium TaxID=82985 RepID=UPI000699F895|nr:prophage tail fiber N-terminal domain-containing protein [Pragia fontium]